MSALRWTTTCPTCHAPVPVHPSRERTLAVCCGVFAVRPVPTDLLIAEATHVDAGGHPFGRPATLPTPAPETAVCA